METKYIYIIVIIAILTISAIAIILCYQSIQSKNKKLAKLADILSALAVEEQMAEQKLGAAQLYNSAWFQSIKMKYEEKQKAKEEYMKQNPCKPYPHFSRFGPPPTAFELEDEMMSKCADAETEEEAVSIIAEYVPQTINALLGEKQNMVLFGCNLSQSDRERFSRLYKKYDL